VVADLNLDLIQEVRAIWQFFRDRRRDTYKPISLFGPKQRHQIGKIEQPVSDDSGHCRGAFAESSESERKLYAK
jgi:hypothetical protein